MMRLGYFVIGALFCLTVACGSKAEGEADAGQTTCQGLTCLDASSGQPDAGAEPDATVEVDAGMADAGFADASAPDAMPRPTLMAAGANEADILYGWVAAGQPSEARVREIVETGATIISLRTPAEDPFDEPGLVMSLGGIFIRYPTTASNYSSVDFREAMYDLYDEQLNAGVIVYLHCASSNRAGASWALYQAERKGVDPEDAIAMGRAAGLSSLESTVRQVLGL